MAEYSKLAKGTLISNGGANYVNLPFQPEFVEFINFTAATTPVTGGIPFAWWDDNMGQGAAVYDIYNATPVLTTATTLAGGISTFAAGLALQYGASFQIVSITGANPAVVTTSVPNGYVTGQVVILEGLNETPTTGMPQIAGIPFVITVTSPTTFTIPWNTAQSNYTPLTGSPAGAMVKQVLYPYLYVPGVNIISAITLGTTTTVVTTNPNNYVVGQEVAFRIPQAYGTIQLNSLPDVFIPGSPIYGYVTAIVNPTTFIVNINSTTFTAFNTNQTFAQMVGQTFPQVVAVGDINSGGTPYTGGNLYPSPLVNGIPTINGPAISGAFVNNTSQGFTIGPVVGGTAGNVLFWRAYYFDYGT